ncbi:MAG: YidC/Oxa1 family membrane protein insertase [Clostridia bacterium]|nr:YidC/Oxa1 family membrane protein insertase [Clostridia bacterium]
MAFFANMFGYVLNFIYEIVKNYGVAIIIFSILIKLVMLPISIKQQKTMKKSAKIQKKMKEIQQKYKNNPEKLNQETLELYRRENMSPFSGCFSAIAQIVLLFAVFFLVKSPLTHMKKIDIDVINKYEKIMQQNDLVNKSGGYPEIELIRETENIKKLKDDAELKEQEQTDKEENKEENQNQENEEKKETSEGEQEKISLSEIKDEEIDSLYINMDFLGVNLAQVPTKSSDWKAYIIPVLYVIISIISMRITNASMPKVEKTKTEDGEEEFDPMAQMNKNMNIMFPFLYVTVALVAPLGLALYWLMNSLLMIVEKLVLNKLLKEEEEEE